jgi:hypothetical protein
MSNDWLDLEEPGPCWALKRRGADGYYWFVQWSDAVAVAYRSLESAEKALEAYRNDPSVQVVQLSWRPAYLDLRD